MAYNLDSAYQKAIIKAVEYHFPNAKIVLFGSRVRGNNRLLSGSVVKSLEL